MNKSINRTLMLLGAIKTYLDRFKALLGDRWPDFHTRIRTIVKNLAQAQDEQTPLYVSQLIDLILDTPAADLGRAILRQVDAAIGDTESDVCFKVVDPGTGQIREVTINRGLREKDTTVAVFSPATAEIRAAIGALSRVLRKIDTGIVLSDTKINQGIINFAYKIWLAGLGALVCAEQEGRKFFKMLVQEHPFTHNFIHPRRKPICEPQRLYKNSIT